VNQARIDSGKGPPGALTSAEKEEPPRLRKEVHTLRLEREIPKKSGGLLREREQVKFSFIDAEKANFPITMLYRLLKVSRPGFYAWFGRPPSPRAVEDAQLTVLVREAHLRGRKTYGSPRIHKDLIAQEVFVSRKRVIRLMQAEKIVGRQRRRYRSTTMSEHEQPIAPNLLAQDFRATQPNQKWVSDTTELVTSEGRIYLAVVVDLFSRFFVGWALSASNNRHLTLKALEMALQRRSPTGEILHHSDQGSTYAADDYQRVLDAAGITCSMSRRGNCYDNAAMESWFSPLKSELGERFVTHGEAKEKLFDHIEVFYNQQRMHTAIGYVSPAEFERRYLEKLAA
jgi:transposase InsO family protein